MHACERRTAKIQFLTQESPRLKFGSLPRKRKGRRGTDEEFVVALRPSDGGSLVMESGSTKIWILIRRPFCRLKLSVVQASA